MKTNKEMNEMETMFQNDDPDGSGSFSFDDPDWTENTAREAFLNDLDTEDDGMWYEDGDGFGPVFAREDYDEEEEEEDEEDDYDVWHDEDTLIYKRVYGEEA